MTRTTFEDAPAFGIDPFGGEGTVLSRTVDTIVWVRERQDGTVDMCNQSVIDPILEANAERRAETEGKSWGDGQVVASVPNALLYGDGYYAKAREAGDKKAMMKWLDDSDHAKLRTKTGRLT